MCDLKAQFAEIEFLAAVLGKRFKREWQNYYLAEVTTDINLYVTFPPNYPSREQPVFELMAPTLSAKQKVTIWQEFKKIFKNYAGSPVVYQCIVKLEQIATCNFSPNEKKSSAAENGKSIPKVPTYRFPITHGDVITDRKSSFQGHVAIVETPQDTEDFLAYLRQSIKKLEHAKHNVTVYRLKTKRGIQCDSDNDGENAAGGRLAHLLKILKVDNVMVVVTRWYGGVQIGPDRFKHYNNAARNALELGGFITK